MNTLINALSEYGKANYEAFISSMPKQNEESRHVIYYGSLMTTNN